MTAKRGFPPFRVSALVLYLGVLVFATVGPVSDLPRFTFPAADKLVHVVLFGGLVPLIYLNLTRRERGRCVLSVLLSLALAGTVELVQIPLPYRNGDILDLLAGFVGAVCAGALTPVVFDLSRRWRADGLRHESRV